MRNIDGIISIAKVNKTILGIIMLAKLGICEGNVFTY